MAWQGRDRFTDDLLQISKKACELRRRQAIRQRVIAVRHQILPQQHLLPGHFGKQLILLPEDLRAVTE